MKISTAILILIIGACQSRPSDPVTGSATIRYSEKLRITENEIFVSEPWPGSTRPWKFELTNPPKRVVVTSTTHIPYFELLGLEDRLVGFPSVRYIYSPAIRKRVDNGDITNLGPDGSMNLELLFGLDPDLVIAFDMGSESATLDKVQEAGIPLIYNADYLENTSLGRAEWIKFFGALFGVRDKADSIFTKIEERYLELKDMAANVSTNPSVLSGLMYGDVWFLPGGNNWSAEFIATAGGRYLWAENENNGWLELSFESVLDKAELADFWIGTSTLNSLDELRAQDIRYAEFRAFREGNVYNYGKRRSPGGGYDYLESGYARPDIVLADMIHILHPEMLPEHELYYYERLP